jgi:hypothetical protein
MSITLTCPAIGDPANAVKSGSNYVISITGSAFSGGADSAQPGPLAGTGYTKAFADIYPSGTTPPPSPPLVRAA